MPDFKPKEPEVGQWWEADFAFLHILAKHEQWVWVSIIPKKAMDDSLKTMHVLAFGDYRLMSEDERVDTP